ncbi:ABC-type iron transport system FetAB ATPase subunit [Rhizobium mongolense]
MKRKCPESAFIQMILAIPPAYGKVRYPPKPASRSNAVWRRKQSSYGRQEPLLFIAPISAIAARLGAP